MVARFRHTDPSASIKTHGIHIYVLGEVNSDPADSWKIRFRWFSRAILTLQIELEMHCRTICNFKIHINLDLEVRIARDTAAKSISTKNQPGQN